MKLDTAKAPSIPKSRGQQISALVLLVGMIVGGVFLLRWCIGANEVAEELRKLRRTPIVCECRCP